MGFVKFLKDIGEDLVGAAISQLLQHHTLHDHYGDTEINDESGNIHQGSHKWCRGCGGVGAQLFQDEWEHGASQ